MASKLVGGTSTRKKSAKLLEAEQHDAARLEVQVTGTKRGRGRPRKLRSPPSVVPVLPATPRPRLKRKAKGSPSASKKVWADSYIGWNEYN